MDQSADTQVFIVGAGPTGLVLALWLTKLGVAVRIIDKTSEPGTTSRALAVSARTLELHGQVGLAQAIVDEGVQVPGLNIWTRGKRAAHLFLGKMGEGFTRYPFLLIYPQDAHERLLVETLHSLGVEVERRTELVKLDERQDGVTATLKNADGSEATCDAAYVAGCDGAHSIVRQALDVGFPGGTYSSMFYVADAEASGPAVNREIHVELEDADFLALFPLKKTGHVRLIGTVQAQSLVQKKEFAFADVSQRVIERMQLAIERVNWFSTYHVHHRVAATFREGRAFLLGDAAHIHSPVGGQGMNTGIGDAVNLSWKLAAVLDGKAPDDILDTYEVERIAFARKLVATTDRVFTIATKRDLFTRLVRTRLAPAVLPLAFKTAMMRRFMFRLVSQTAIEYRASALSEGSVGEIHGGDRLPWVELAPHRDNFEPLKSLAWQVHVYGEPKAGIEETCATLQLPLHTFSWIPAMERAGFTRGAIYLIRPDGYVAMAAEGTNPQRLDAYFARRRLSKPSYS